MTLGNVGKKYAVLRTEGKGIKNKENREDMSLVGRTL